MESPISERKRARGAWLVGSTLPLLVIGLMGARSAIAAEPPPAAAAADPQARADATARLVEGVELLRLGRNAEALRKFDEAYARVPSVNIQYNRGLAFRGLGQNAAAIEAFDTFLASATHPPPGKREQAQQYRNELRARVARVALTSELPGAELLIDGHPNGFATAGRIVYLDPGPHQLLARRDGGGSAGAQVVASAGQELAITLRTTPAAAAAVAAAPAPPAAPSSRALAAREGPGEAPAPSVTPAANHDDAPASPEPSWTAAPRWTFVVAASGVVLLGAGLTFELLARGEADHVSDASKSGTPTVPAPYDPAWQENGERYQTLGIISLAAGGAALIAGITGYVLARGSISEREHAAHKPARGAASLAARPLLGPTLAGARLEVSF